MDGRQRRPRARLLDVAGLTATCAVWWATGWTRAGLALVEALGEADPARQTVAGMLLVKAGRRAVPLLRRAVRERRGLPLALTVLGDIGDPAARADLLGFAADRDPLVARAAHEALRTLDAASGP